MGNPTDFPSHPIQQDWTVAFVMSRRIGDTLISMVLVNNLMRHGIAVTVFSRHLDAMREWFPGVEIRPELDAGQARGELSRFDLVLHAYANDAVGDTLAWHPRAWVMDHWPTYRQVKPMIDIQLDVCRECFGLPDPTRDNGLVVPPGAVDVAVRNRVIIHPTASDVHKQWLPLRFLALARRLRKQGYEPWFVVAPSERADWRWIEAQGERLVAYASLADVAAWLATAGVFVGNDSGLAHLASNVGVPTVSLALRPRIALRWRPGWSPALAITAPPLMPGRWLREVSWKYLLPVSCVATAVERLRSRMAQTARAFGPQPGATEAPPPRPQPACTRPPVLSVSDRMAEPRAH